LELGLPEILEWLVVSLKNKLGPKQVFLELLDTLSDRETFSFYR